MVRLNTEKSKETWLEHFELLSKHKNESPDIWNEPGIDTLVATIRRDQDLGHAGQ